MQTNVPIPPAIPGAPDGIKGDATGGVIPYKNPRALISYYLGLFSLFPVLGLILGVVAIVLGIQGIKFYRKHPQVRGIVHAWIGICAGAGAMLLQAGIVCAIVAAAKR